MRLKVYYISVYKVLLPGMNYLLGTTLRSLLKRSLKIPLFLPTEKSCLYLNLCRCVLLLLSCISLSSGASIFKNKHSHWSLLITIYYYRYIYSKFWWHEFEKIADTLKKKIDLHNKITILHFYFHPLMQVRQSFCFFL